MSIPDERSVTITEESLEQFKRLDQFLSYTFKDLSRTFIKNLYNKNLIIFSDSSPYKGKLELKKMPPLNSELSILLPPPLPSEAIAENLPLDILFEDEHLIIINKAAGMVVHPAPGHSSGTLVNAVLYHCPDLQAIGDTKRPGIVHRLDKGTSGVMVVAKNQKCHEGLVLLFSEHNIKRQYLALSMSTKLESSGTLESLIGRHPQNRLKMSSHIKQGKTAISHFKVSEYFSTCTLMEMTLETGRTHQIRVHLSELLNASICMDPLYGQPKDHLKRLPPKVCAHLRNYSHPLLHAQILGFVHPITKKELYFETKPSDIFSKALKFLREENEHS